MLLRAFLFFIVVLALGIGIDALAENPGALSLEWYGWKVQTSAAFALVAVGILGLAVVMLTSLYIWLVNAPKRLHKHLAYKRQEKGFLAFNDALQALAIGEDDTAMKSAKEAHKLLPKMPLADTLLAEVTSRKQAKGKAVESTREFRKFLEKPHTKIIGLRGLLGESLEKGDSKQALTYALDFYREKPKSPYILNILTHLYARQQQVAEALFYAEKYAKVTDKNAKDGERAAFVLSCLQRLQAQQLAVSGKTDEALKLADKALKQNPTFVPLALQLAHLYDQQGKPEKGRKVLKATYKDLPNLKVGRTWLAMHHNTKESALEKKVQKFTSAWPEQLSSQLLMAQFYLQTRKYTDARKIMDEALLKGEDRTLLQQMAELESIQQPNSPHAAKLLQKALTAPDRLQAFDGQVAAFDTWRRTLVESPLVHLQNLQMPTSLATALVTYEHEAADKVGDKVN